MYRTTLDLHRAKVHKIMEPLPFDKGEMKFYSFVAVDTVLSLPLLDQLLGKTDTNQIMEGLRPAIREVADQVWESHTIRRVRKHHSFNFGDTGRALINAVSETPPTQIDWILLLVEIDNDLRDATRRAGESVEENELQKVAEGLALLAGTGFGATAAAAFSISVVLIKHVAKIMQENNNDQVGYIEQSFLLGDDFNIGRGNRREATSVSDLTNNMFYDYTLTVTRESDGPTV